MAELLEELKIGLQDRYDVQRELGRGGMATVFLARDVKHERSVAVKVLHHDLAAALGAERFRREIQIATSLSHPHILTSYDSGEAGDSLYYVMPFVEGESLRQRIDREKQLPINDALRIAQEVASALDYARYICPAVECESASIQRRGDNRSLDAQHESVVCYHG